MRVTLTIDDDLAGLMKRRARELGLPFKEVVKRTLRAGLGEEAKSRKQSVPKVFSHSFGFKPGINLDKLNQLLDELEVKSYGAAERRSAKQAARSATPPRARRG